MSEMKTSRSSTAIELDYFNLLVGRYNKLKPEDIDISVRYIVRKLNELEGIVTVSSTLPCAGETRPGVFSITMMVLEENLSTLFDVFDNLAEELCRTNNILIPSFVLEYATLPRHTNEDNTVEWWNSWTFKQTVNSKEYSELLLAFNRVLAAKY